MGFAGLFARFSGGHIFLDVFRIFQPKSPKGQVRHHLCSPRVLFLSLSSVFFGIQPFLGIQPFSWYTAFERYTTFFFFFFFFVWFEWRGGSTQPKQAAMATAASSVQIRSKRTCTMEWTKRGKVVAVSRWKNTEYMNRKNP
eukprot:NODE_540_length_1308_cov_238.903098_g306_i3.p2 GENE.NODE_540_length_1308_cov_238.903098_g306_i3~~NODE_540_length_1308_cov_238.903098_g306_i3.p2  ORF type:complete len:141 (-),score=16.58 NODE_540_length_1308_cov_238.903098_g306_i3:314-736(-)